jgi:cytochrome P450
MLPPGPPEPPAIQTARWLLRPISFMESCRRRFGESFSVRFLGFRTPMVMLSDPAAIRTLYTERRHGLPPGRGVALLPVVGPRSVLLLEGSEHLARRKLMLPPFHGERMRAYEATVREVVERDVAGWPRGEPFPVHPRMQAVTLEVIVRAVFGVRDPARGERLRELLRALLDATASFGLQFGFMLARRLGAPDPLEKLRRQRAEIDELLLAEIGERRASGGGEDILSLLLDARFEDGAAMADQEICDQLVTLLVAGHETTATALAWTLELLTHHPQTLARLGCDVPEGRDQRVAAAAPGGAAGGAAAVLAAGGRRGDPARGHRRDPGDLARPHARRRLSRPVRLPA